MPHRRTTIALLAIATLVSGSAAWSTADARVAGALGRWPRRSGHRSPSLFAAMPAGAGSLFCLPPQHLNGRRASPPAPAVLFWPMAHMTVS